MKTWFVLPLLLGLSLALAATTPQEQVKMGEAYVGRGKGRQAVPLLESALKSDDLDKKTRARGEGARQGVVDGEQAEEGGGPPRERGQAGGGR